MPGKNITLYEKRNSLDGCCDAYSGEAGYICPGERELEPFMECLWYLCSKIPSLEDPSISVLDESVRANKDMPIHSESRLLCKQGHIYEKVHDSPHESGAAPENGALHQHRRKRIWRI
ncbi:MAG: oleate hydratase [Angelakisella sp.]